ncbi:TPA: hypothetical protein DDZ86_04945 [Candidatus Dependentiae bacterium]|nr:MAG: hypothetical protein A2Y17_09750 [Clostridiales bacterium GWF2_38_85]HBL98958.1 hypothetical protein [Candidatus Dependentiae bacterium]
MTSPLTIGIDIGGTNTDCVVLNKQQQIVFRTKTATSSDIVGGIDTVLTAARASATLQQHNVKAIFISSTHATNALLEARNLLKVGVLRIASNNPSCIPSCLGWPEPIKAALNLQTITIPGGHEVDGQAMDKLDRKTVLDATEMLIKGGAESIVIIGVFSPLYPEHERYAADSITSRYPAIPVTCSRDVGGSGFIERENAAILNASLKKCVKNGFDQIEALCMLKGFTCPVFAVQNNGSTISLQEAHANPISLLAAGPTNSCMGAAHLSKLTTCVVVDIGGTSTDIGLIKNSNARRTFGTSAIAGVSLNFSMPDVLSLALGGGSIVSISHNNTPTIGPCSVGSALLQKAYCGGGNTLTLTDCALQCDCYDNCGNSSMLTPKAAAPINKKDAHAVMELAIQTIARAIERFACLEKEIPVVFVGGGAALFPLELIKTYFPNRTVIKPLDLEVANACGAACAVVSGTVDETVLLEQREATMKMLQQKAVKLAIEKGAEAKTVVIQDETVLPYAYVSKPTARVRIVATGKLKV